MTSFVEVAVGAVGMFGALAFVLSFWWLPHRILRRYDGYLPFFLLTVLEMGYLLTWGTCLAAGAFYLFGMPAKWACGAVFVPMLTELLEGKGRVIPAKIVAVVTLAFFVVIYLGIAASVVFIEEDRTPTPGLHLDEAMRGIQITSEQAQAFHRCTNEATTAADTDRCYEAYRSSRDGRPL